MLLGTGAEEGVESLIGTSPSPLVARSSSLAPTSPESILPEFAVEGITDNAEGLLVTRVVDGDTIQLENGQTVRYIGVDTPESVHPRQGVECFGKEASQKNEELVLGKRVQLEKDVSETDRYGRLLRYVYVDGMFVNDELVRQGYANSLSYPPDVKHQDQFRAAEQEARAASRGLWGSCVNGSSDTSEVTTPAGGGSSEAGEGTSTCPIKGNINSTGEKIYHVPGCGSYDNTSIDPARGEQYFCTEEEATSAGWRKAGNC